jgi:DNA-binding IclR family transcriptional regulator
VEIPDMEFRQFIDDHDGRRAEFVRENLEALQIRHLAEWDVLAFIYRHGTNLASADYIARLLGYGKAVVGAALDSLTSSGLVKRSRNSHGARLYQIAASIPGDRGPYLEEMMKLTEGRRGRILLIAHLRQASGNELRGRVGLHLA